MYNKSRWAKYKNHIKLGVLLALAFALYLNFEGFKTAHTLDRERYDAWLKVQGLIEWRAVLVPSIINSAEAVMPMDELSTAIATANAKYLAALPIAPKLQAAMQLDLALTPIRRLPTDLSTDIAPKLSDFTFAEAALKDATDNYNKTTQAIEQYQATRLGRLFSRLSGLEIPVYYNKPKPID